MHKWTIAAAAAAIVQSGVARAHEFACEKTIDDAVVRVVDHYPATLQFRIVLTNTHPEDASVALSIHDDLLDALGVKLAATPLTLQVGESVDLTASVTVESEAQCLKLAGTQSCTAQAENGFQVRFDGGMAQCSARLVCKHDEGMGGAGGREK